MRPDYAVTWSRPGGPVFAGRLELRDDVVVLRGAAGSEHVRYEDVRGVRRARTLAERVRGRTSIVLELAAGELSIASFDQPGALNEVVERLAAAAA
jgi:hypothetical protein